MVNGQEDERWKKVYSEAGMIPHEKEPVAPVAEQERSPSSQATAEPPRSPAQDISQTIDYSLPVVPQRTSYKRYLYPLLFLGGIFGLAGVLSSATIYLATSESERLCKRILTRTTMYTQITTDSFCEDKCNQEQFYTLYYSLRNGNLLGPEALERTAVRQAETLVEKVRETCEIPSKK